MSQNSAERPVVPGEIILGESPLVPAGRARRSATVRVLNNSCWPVAVTSHFHFFEVNRRMRFDRSAAFGMHLDVIAGGAVRWSPGEIKAVDLVEYSGEREIHGFNGFTNACLADPETFETLRSQAVQRITSAGYENVTLPGMTRAEPSPR